MHDPLHGIACVGNYVLAPRFLVLAAEIRCLAVTLLGLRTSCPAIVDADLSAGELDQMMKQGTKRGRGGTECALEPSQPHRKRAAKRRGTTRTAAVQGAARQNTQAQRDAIAAAGLEDDDA